MVMNQQEYIRRAILCKEFRKTEEWKVIKTLVFERSEGRCECPGGYDNGGVRGSTRCRNDALQIHHETYPEIPETDVHDSLLALCMVCHATRHEKISVLKTIDCCKYRQQDVYLVSEYDGGSG